MLTRTRSLPLLAGLVLLGAAPAAAQAQGQVELRPASGPAGSAVILDGSGFPASGRVRVGVSHGHARSVRASRSGAFTTRLTVPRGKRGWVSIVSHGGRRRVVNRFLASASRSGSSTIEIASSAGSRVRVTSTNTGGHVSLRLSGSGFGGGERLTVRVAGVTKRLTARRDGRFSATLALPGTRSAGSFPFVLSGRKGRLTFRLAVAPADGSPAGSGTSGSPLTGSGGVLAPSLPAPATKPAAATAPSISGQSQSGKTLSANPGTWTGTAPIGYAYQWQSCDSGGSNCAAIGGATGPNYALGDGDVGDTIRVLVTASNTAGSASATSAATAVVAAAPTPPANTALPKLSGAAQDGQTVKTSKGTWTGTAPITYGYRWQRCNSSGSACADIAGATSSSYAVTTADVGSRLRAAVTATNAAASVTAFTSTSVVVQPESAPSGTVAEWHMDEASGSSMFDSVGGHTGTLHSVSVGQPGSDGLAYSLNGTSSYVTVPSSTDLDPGNADVTITIRMKSTYLADAGQDEDWDLIRKGVYASSPGEYKMEYYPDGQALCGFKGIRADGTTGYGEAKGGPALNDGQWHTIQCVKTPTQVKTIVDGTTVATKTVEIGYISSTDEIIIGAHSPTSELYHGLLDEASIRFG